MRSFTSLSIYSKESDKIMCPNCSKGIMVPYREDMNINHGFYCNKCGMRVNIDTKDAIVE